MDAYHASEVNNRRRIETDIQRRGGYLEKKEQGAVSQIM